MSTVTIQAARANDMAAVFCSRSPMPAASSPSPEVVAGWLASLSPGAVAIAVLGPDGAVLAGDPELGARATRALEDAPGVRGITSRSAPAVMVVARDGDRAVAIELPAPALPGLARADLAAALDLLGGG